MILGAVFGGACEIRGEGGMGVSFGTNDGCWVSVFFFFPVKKKIVPVKKPQKTLKSARENPKVPVKFFIKSCP